jgi:hypothetical protein
MTTNDLPTVLPPAITQMFNELSAEAKRRLRPDDLYVLCRLVRWKIQQLVQLPATDSEHITSENAAGVLKLLSAFESDWLGLDPTTPPTVH